MTNPTPHGQVPEALIDLIDAYAETRHRCGGIYNARTEAARKAVIEALSGVQALSAAPEAIAKLRHLYQNMVNGAVRDTASAKRIAEGLLAPAIEALERATPPAEQQAQAGAVPQGWKAVPVNPTPEMWKAAKTVPDPNPPYPPHYGLVWDAMLAASPTPPAEQQAAPKAAPTLPEGWTDCTIEFGNDGPEVVAYGPKRMMNRLAKWLGKYFAQVIADAAPKAAPVVWLSSKQLRGVTALHGQYLPFRRQPEGRFDTPVYLEQAAHKAAPGVGNSGFDHQTAADFLSGKTVIVEALREFVHASRRAHDEKTALSAMLLSVRGVLTSREAEIAHLKKALLEAEAAPQQEAQAPVAYVHVPHSTVEGKVRPVVSFEKYQQDYADGIYSTRIPLYTAPLPAPDCHHRPRAMSAQP